MGFSCALLQALDIGGAAAPLSDVTWIKDTPIAWSGHVTVLVFWDAHTPVEVLTRLSDAQHDDGAWVQIAALSSDPANLIKAFVDDQGADMDYHVGRIDSAAAQVLMGKEHTLPRICLIDDTGRLAWRGLPGDYDSVLRRLHSGSSNTDMLVRLEPLEQALDAFFDTNQSTDDAEQEQALAVTAKMLTIDPINLRAFNARLWLCAQLEKPTLAEAAWQELPIARLSAEDANSLARERLDDENPALRYPAHAYACARHVCELAPASAYAHDLLARILAASGSLEQAIAEETHAVQIDPHDDSLVATLDYYHELLSLRTRISQQPVPDHPAAVAPP